MNALERIRAAIRDASSYRGFYADLDLLLEVVETAKEHKGECYCGQGDGAAWKSRGICVGCRLDAAIAALEKEA